MAWNGHPPQSPWDFFHTTPTQGAGIGIDHTTGPTFPQGFPFGPGGFNPWAHRGGWGWGGPPGRHEWGGRHGGRHGRRHRRGGDEEPPYTDGEQQEDTAMLSENEKPVGEKDDSPDTMRAASGEHPDPPESVPQPPNFHRHGHGFRGRGRCGGRGGAGMRGHHHHGPPPHFGVGGGFPWGMMSSFAQSPFGQGLREYLDRAAQGDNNNTANNNNENVEEDVESFQPPVDVFRNANGWILHIAVPGAKKEDVGVNWDADKGTLSVSGVVYRPGDEEFLKGLVSGERKVGLFKREVKLPPAGEEKGEKGEKDEVDGEGIRARMEDGILVVSVPVVEREWTEVRKVDIL